MFQNVSICWLYLCWPPCSIFFSGDWNFVYEWWKLCRVWLPISSLLCLSKRQNWGVYFCLCDSRQHRERVQKAERSLKGSTSKCDAGIQWACFGKSSHCPYQNCSGMDNMQSYPVPASIISLSVIHKFMLFPPSLGGKMLIKIQKQLLCFCVPSVLKYRWIWYEAVGLCSLEANLRPYS